MLPYERRIGEPVPGAQAMPDACAPGSQDPADAMRDVAPPGGWVDPA